VRDWIYVEDHCEGILRVLRAGRPGERYNIGAGEECTNLALVDRICTCLEAVVPAADNPRLAAAGVGRYQDLKRLVPDRPGHDRRYAIDASRMRGELGWRPAHDLETGLAATLHWFLANREWCETVQAGSYRRERLGLGGEEAGPGVPSTRFPARGMCAGRTRPRKGAQLRDSRAHARRPARACADALLRRAGNTRASCRLRSTALPAAVPQTGRGPRRQPAGSARRKPARARGSVSARSRWHGT
jgi:hypothetical protein